MNEKIGFKAHARLLTMLGEQLIKNDRVALVELVKNSYDADATRVDVDFVGFAEDFTPLAESRIVVTDNGIGMTQGLVRTAWMNPATPSKALEKRAEPKTTRGRVLQGEKGIGRFATFKLGSEVSLTTRAKGQPDETTLVVDISALDPGEESERPDLELDYFLEDVPALIDSGPPTVFDGNHALESEHGTRLEISRVRTLWNEDLVRGAYEDLERIRPLLWDGTGDADVASDFEVRFARDGTDLALGRERAEHFQAVLGRAVLRVTKGKWDQDSRRLSFVVNGRAESLSIDDAAVRGLKPFNDWFLREEGSRKRPTEARVDPECGSFGFQFYLFDLAPSAPPEHFLDKDDNKLVKSHRIYLYRDGIRVYPYGDPDDDWLEIDSDRGTESAGRTVSNDQTVGLISISQLENPNLQDKTSREGLLDNGRAVGDFKALIKTVLRYLRTKPYQQYVDANRRVRERQLKQHRIDQYVQALRKEKNLPASALKHLDALEVALGAEREYSAMQIGRTEQLAGVGLSVETASHDLVLAGTEALRLARQVVAEMKILDLTREPVYTIATSLVSRLEFVSARFRDVQGLFVSTRQKHTQQDVVQMLRRVRAIYARLHEEESIEFEIDDGATLKALSTEAAVLQLLINLVDNSTYWLMASTSRSRVIRAFTPDDRTLVVTDNGPGIADQDRDFIFEPFYSGKGEAGKGLGLYIARQNGLRNGFSVELGTTGDPRELPGATFLTRFGPKESEDVNS